MHEIGIFAEALKLQLGWNGYSVELVTVCYLMPLKGGMQKQRD